MSVNPDYSGSRADRKPPAASFDRPGWSIGADPVTYPCPWSRGTTDWREEGEGEGNGDGDECDGNERTKRRRRRRKKTRTTKTGALC
jgi:hypothetical protein